jgi:hypothetical protein
VEYRGLLRSKEVTVFRGARRIVGGVEVILKVFGEYALKSNMNNPAPIIENCRLCLLNTKNPHLEYLLQCRPESHYC